MSTDKPSDSTRQSDALLWLGGAMIVGMGAIWLVMAKPWAGGGTTGLPQTAEATPAPESRPATQSSGRPGVQAELDNSLDGNPLRMAELAYEAGMLVEPEDYSAWALYRRALAQDPSSTAAREGLEKIANELLRRAEVAVEQGRFADARATIDRIRSAIPVHTGANELAFRIDALAPRRPRVAEPEEAVEARSAEPQPEATQARAEQRPAERAPEPEPARAPEQPRIDPMLAPHQAFLEALSQNRLLTPPGSSAKYFVDVLASLDPNHELTRQARSLLFAAFLERSAEARIALDTEAAQTWIEEADRLGVDPNAIAAARAELRDQLIEIESKRRIPATLLTVVSYTPPEYPSRALERALEGWVDIDFTVGLDGSTRDIVVTDASHNSYFRDEAVEAVAKWRFEPRVFMDQKIEQRAYTRIRFNFE